MRVNTVFCLVMYYYWKESVCTLCDMFLPNQFKSVELSFFSQLKSILPYRSCVTTQTIEELPNLSKERVTQKGLKKETFTRLCVARQPIVSPSNTGNNNKKR